MKHLRALLAALGVIIAILVASFGLMALLGNLAAHKLGTGYYVQIGGVRLEGTRLSAFAVVLLLLAVSSAAPGIRRCSFRKDGAFSLAMMFLSYVVLAFASFVGYLVFASLWFGD